MYVFKKLRRRGYKITVFLIFSTYIAVVFIVSVLFYDGNEAANLSVLYEDKEKDEIPHMENHDNSDSKSTKFEYSSEANNILTISKNRNFKEDEIYEQDIRMEEHNQIEGLGENGAAAHFSGEFNEILSARISYSREVPDTRDPQCKNVTYNNILPVASVIIIFTNEAWSSFIRTIHSVLNRSPGHLIKEILLVDDFSDKLYLKGKLDYYIKTRLPPKVRVIRLTKRSGVAKARLAGAKNAVGDVLVFMDAHFEMGYTWLEPLLQRIKEGRTRAVAPIIECIDKSTLEYIPSYSNFIGGFHWNGDFEFAYLSKKELEKRNLSIISPRKSPTILGGLFAINRKYFWEIGSYDTKMEIWGSENVEMSFRIWQCGGSLEIVPCSRVGHICRGIKTYTFPGNLDSLGYNSARMAEVWMDEYKSLFYLHYPKYKGKYIGDLTERRALRERLKCKSFEWYLSSVCPDKYFPIQNLAANGQVRNQLKCLDDFHEKRSYELGIYQCNTPITVTQLFLLTQNGELRKDYVCAEIQNVALNPVRVIMNPCHGQKGNQEWKFTTNSELVHVQTGLCLDALDNDKAGKVTASNCNGSVWQKWEWSNPVFNVTKTE